MADFVLGKIKFVWKGAWATATAYTVDDVVKYGGKAFVCKTNNTSAAAFETDLTAVKWEEMVGGTDWKGTYADATFYKVNDLVKYGAGVQICTVAHTSTSATLDASKFTAFVDTVSLLTTRGDVLTRDASAAIRLAVGGSGTYLTNDGTDVSWSTTGVVPSKVEGTNFTGSILVGHSTTGTLNSADRNVGIGIDALNTITGGDENVVIGHSAGTAITTGQYNTYVGGKAGITNATGSNNTGIGRYALYYQSGTQNTVVGAAAMTGNGAFNYNTAIGFESLSAVNTGDYNIGLGRRAGYNLTTGSGNVIIGGVNAGAVDDDRTLLIAGNDGSTTTTWITGDSAGEVTIPATLTTTVNTKTGVAIPGKSGGTNFTGSLLVGHSTTGTLSSASSNTAVGINAFKAVTSADECTIMGYNAGDAITTGGYNTCIGAAAGGTLTTGSKNVAIGWGSITQATGHRNTAIGADAGYSTTTGDNNISIGMDSARNLTSGDGNVTIGTVNVASATGDKQLIIAGYDGSTTTTWIKGDSSGVITFNGAYAFPAADGSSSGDLLQTDGAGTLTFVAPAAGGISMGKAIAASIVFG